MSNEAFFIMPYVRFWTRKEGFSGKLTFKPIFLTFILGLSVSLYCANTDLENHNIDIS